MLDKTIIFSNRGSGVNKFFAIILCISLYLNGNFFIKTPYVMYATSFFLLMFYTFFILKDSKLKYFSSSTCFFYFACVLSLLANKIDPIFDAYNRLFLFIILTLLVGPLVVSNRLKEFRFLLFFYVMEINVILSGFSSILSLLGIHSGNAYDYINNQYRPDFAGLYNHSMTLGPMSGIAFLYCLNKYFEDNRFKIYYIIFGLFSVLSCLMAGSRVGLFALILSLIVYIYMINKGKLHKFISVLFILSILLIVLFPLYQSSADFLISKFVYGQERGSLTVSRDEKWSARLTEFFSSPLWGIGYGTVDSQLDKVGENGVIEPGSSWLSLLSMTGLIGFFSIFILYLRTILGFLNFKESYSFYFLFSTLILSCIYMFAEGVFLAAGNFMCLLSWLILSISYTLSNEKFK